MISYSNNTINWLSTGAVALLLMMTNCTSAGASAISAVWANDGGDKVTQDELRAAGHATTVLNSVWNGTSISLFAAKNEVVSFNLVLEAASQSAANVKVSLSNLTGPGGSVIHCAPRAKNQLFNWTTTDGELFFVRYLRIKGLSNFGYGLYNGSEPEIPAKLRSPSTPYAGPWTSRPNANKYYPDVAVPLELTPNFPIAARHNQSIWADIYIPKTAAAGQYTGTISVSEGTTVTYRVPVTLNVRNFALPDIPSSKTMLYTQYSDVSRRYTGVNYPDPGTPQDVLTEQVLQNERLLAHRHKISLIGDDATQTGDSPSPAYIPVLSGALFTAANGYAGPGVNAGNNVYSIETYGSWPWAWGTTQAGIQTHTNAWESWFEANSPTTERFVYLIDESSNYAQTQTWANWMQTNPGVGKNLKSMATLDPIDAVASVPSLSIPTGGFTSGITAAWQTAVTAIETAPGKEYFMYNGARPGEGSFCMDCDGVDLREIPWGQYKKGVARWFYWEATYYNNDQGGQGDTNVFQTAQTFGGATTYDNNYGMQGWNSSNGDGVLFYPGMDAIFPASSYGLAGPIASLRLKHWRRGIQDVDYLALAAAKNPAAVAALVQTMVPKAMWELPITAPSDPTYYFNVGPSWSSNPDDWEAARLALAHIIDGR